MLIERNENKQEPVATTTKNTTSPKKLQKTLKENLLQFNNKELLVKSSKINTSEGAIPSEDLFVVETNKIASDYLKKILGNELAKAPDNLRADFLSRHKFGWEIRARMVG